MIPDISGGQSLILVKWILGKEVTNPQVPSSGRKMRKQNVQSWIHVRWIHSGGYLSVLIILERRGGAFERLITEGTLWESWPAFVRHLVAYV